MLRALLISVAVATCTASVKAPFRRRALKKQSDLVAWGDKKADEPKPGGAVGLAYKTCGLATTAAWTKIFLSTVASNAPEGYMMPSSQHGLFARAGCFAVLPLIYTTYSTLATASKDGWEKLGSSEMARLNLALVAAGLGSMAWIRMAPTITMVPGTKPPVSHAGWITENPMLQKALFGAYAASTALSASVWIRSLPADVRSKPLSWPARIGDGVCKTLVTLPPKNANDPVNVKYSVLAGSFLLLTAIQLGSHPLSVVPSWTGRRTSRLWAQYTLLAAAHSVTLKEACESGKLLVDKTYRDLSKGLTTFGAGLSAATFGKVFLDPSFPDAYHAVKEIYGWSAAGAAMVGLTLRGDE